MSATTATRTAFAPTARSARAVRPTASRSTAVRTPVAAPAPLRLTRRGRLVLLAVLVGVLLAAFSFGRTATQAASTPDAGTRPAQVTTVQAGESLWSLARRIAPDNDPREVVAQIRRLNALTSSELQPGQQLLLPVAA